MATIDEIFDTIPNSTFEYLVIDPETRQINVPDGEKIFGVVSDRKSERKHFVCSRYVGDNLDLSKCFIRIQFDNGHDDPDGYLVEDLAYTNDIVTFSWELTDKVVAHQGDITFSVTASNGERTWNTTTATGTSLVGLQADISDVEDQTTDVVVQLRQMVSEQIQNVQNAAAAETEIVKDQIEAKGVETLASIPEDYTTVASKVNNLANALKGHMSGTAVRADDISPVEHYPKITVRPRNLFNTKVIPIMESSKDGVYISDVGEGTITVTSPVGYVGNGFRGTNVTLRQLCPQAVAGRTYTLNAATPSNVKAIFLVGISMVWPFGTSKVMTEQMLDCSTVVYGHDSTIGGIGNCVISNIQLEEGTEATAYVPYVDPETVAVTRCGKNLIPYPYASSAQNYKGITFTPNEDGSVTINGTAIDDGCSFMLVNTGPGSRKVLQPGTYHLSCPEIKTLDVLLSLFYYDDNETTTFSGTTGKNQTFTLTKPQYYGLYFRVYGGVTIDDVTVHPQLEVGSTATGYEPYTSGEVDGGVSKAPTMTLMAADSSNVIIDCEYNRDTNVVIDQLMSAVRALGGNI